MTSKTILRIDASMRHVGSRSRRLTDVLIERLKQTNSVASVTTRDLTEGVPFVDAPWIDANFTAPSERSPAQRAELETSDAILKQVEDADILVIGTPVYNFSIPAALKAWIDMIVRAKQSFRYTPDGPEGLLKDKIAYIVLVSGGTKAGSAMDFASPYLKHILGFIGITDVRFISSDLGGVDQVTADDAAHKAIAEVQ